MIEDNGRVPSEPGSRPTGQAPQAGLDAPRIDPSRALTTAQLQTLIARLPDFNSHWAMPHIEQWFDWFFRLLDAAHRNEIFEAELGRQNAALLEDLERMREACSETLDRLESLAVRVGAGALLAPGAGYAFIDAAAERLRNVLNGGRYHDKLAPPRDRDGPRLAEPRSGSGRSRTSAGRRHRPSPTPKGPQ